MKIFFWLLKNFENTKYYEPLFSKFFGFNLEKLNDDQIRQFLSFYFNQEYDVQSSNIIEAFRIMDAAAKRILVEEVEELVIDSLYFKSMPENILFYSLKTSRSWENVFVLQNGTFLRTYLTSLISKKNWLLTLINERAYIDSDYIFRFLASNCNFCELITSIQKLRFLEDANRLEDIITDLGCYSIDELKSLFMKVDASDTAIVNNFAKAYSKSTLEEKEKGIDATLEMANYAPDYLEGSNYKIRKNGKYVERYDPFCNEIAKSERWTDEMKELLVKRAFETRNFRFLFYWFLAGVACSYNYALIDAILEEDESVIAGLLLCVDDNYLNYVITKIIRMGIPVLENVIRKLSLYPEVSEINRIDVILEIIYYIHFDFKVSKEVAFQLALKGSIYTPKYFHDYDFSEEERRDILESYSNRADKDFYCGLYAPYLESGDKTKLLDQNETIEKIKETRLVRKGVKT